MTSLEIVECGRTIAGPLVAFDIQWQGDPGDAEVTWGVRIASADQSETVELAYVRGADGDRAHVAASGGREEVPADADVSDDEIVARFPADKVGVAVEWPVWTAVVALDGRVVAEQVIPLG